MSATVVEPLDISICTVPSQPSSARAEASKANGRRSNGPTSPEGKERSRRNSCKDGLTGKGVVLPPDAAAEVDRREAGFARDFQPRNAVERELVRQMALGSWRSGVLVTRIIEHDARVNAARFANWVEDERLAAVELGHRLGEDAEAAAAQLKRTSAGCEWLVGRWELLGNGLSTAEEGGPDCRWTDGDLALALDLLGRPAGLRHLDEWPVWLESLRAGARSGSAEAADELRKLVTTQIAELETRGEEAWEEIEEPRLRDWQAGLEIDLGAEGTRLHRYEAAADRLFRSAWRKLEQLRKERGEPLMPGTACGLAPEPAAPCEPPEAPPPETAHPATAQAPARPEDAFPGPSLRSDPAAPVLDFWAGGSPRPTINPGYSSGNKTNPARSMQAKGGLADLIANLS